MSTPVYTTSTGDRRTQDEGSFSDLPICMESDNGEGYGSGIVVIDGVRLRAHWVVEGPDDSGSPGRFDIAGADWDYTVLFHGDRVEVQKSAYRERGSRPPLYFGDAFELDSPSAFLSYLKRELIPDCQEMLEAVPVG